MYSVIRVGDSAEVYQSENILNAVKKAKEFSLDNKHHDYLVKTDNTSALANPVCSCHNGSVCIIPNSGWDVALSVEPNTIDIQIRMSINSKDIVKNWNCFDDRAKLLLLKQYLHFNRTHLDLSHFDWIEHGSDEKDEDDPDSGPY